MSWGFLAAGKCTQVFRFLEGPPPSFKMLSMYFLAWS